MAQKRKRIIVAGDADRDAQPVKPPSERARKHFDKALTELKDEGFNIWGFMFKTSETTLPGCDTPEQILMEIFNSHEEPLPLFIKRTEYALLVIRNTAPEGFDLEGAEQAVAAIVEGSVKILPHIIDRKKMDS